jgi:hypothetical protein
MDSTSLRRRGRPFNPGQSGNPSGRPKMPEGLQARIRDLCDGAVDQLAALLRSDDERLRLEAIKVLLDRGYGKPITPSDVTVRGDDPGQVHLRALVEIARARSAKQQALTASLADNSDGTASGDTN